MPFLMEVTGRHRVSLALRVFRFTDLAGGFNTAANDVPANVHYAPRILQAGNYRRTLFGSGGRTSGVADVDRGTATLNNVDGGLDVMRDYAFDGYPLSIWEIDGKRSRFASRVLLTTGTLEQTGVTWDEVTLALRSRLAVLDVPIQTKTYEGTTTNGVATSAEGGADLKGTPRLLLFGRQRNMPALLLHPWKGVYGVGQRLGQVFTVRNDGTVLTATGQDYPTLITLLNANVSAGQWATCRALGLVRIGGNAASFGQITVDAAEGASVAQRTAGQVARRILVEQAGFVPGVDFLEEDIAALDAAAPYEVGYWTGTNRVNTLAVVSTVLASVRGFISPDRTGLFRIGQFRAPRPSAKRPLSRIELQDEDGAGLRRLPTGDDGRGIPAKKIVVEHSINHAVVSADRLTGNARENDPAFVEFAGKAWRQAEVANTRTADLHKLAPEMVFQTCLVHAADAQSEAQALMALYGVQRDHFSLSVRTREAARFDLADDVPVRVGRFGLDAGKSFIAVGMLENHEEGTTTMDVWG